MEINTKNMNEIHDQLISFDLKVDEKNRKNNIVQFNPQANNVKAKNHNDGLRNLN